MRVPAGSFAKLFAKGWRMALRTPLYDTHVSLGARMVDFAGWDMPVQYQGITLEHQAVRTAAGIFDISHMGRLAIPGPEAAAFVQRVYTNDAVNLKVGQARYGFICNDAGGILDDVLVYGQADGRGMVVNASNRGKIVNWLSAHQSERPIQVVDRTFETCMIALQGPQAVNIIAGMTPANAAALGYYFSTETTYQGKPCTLSRTGYTGEDGFELIVPRELGPVLWAELSGKGAAPCGLGSRDTLRLEAAMALYGHELNDGIDPMQAGLSWAVKMDKGEFIGKAGLEARAQNRNRPVRIGLELEGKRIARENAPVLKNGQVIGTVSSGTFGPTVNKVIAMAYVAPEHATIGSACDVDVRGKPAAAKVVALPFYRRKRNH